MEWIVMELEKVLYYIYHFVISTRSPPPSEHIQEKCSPATGWQQGGLVSWWVMCHYCQIRHVGNVWSCFKVLKWCAAFLKMLLKFGCFSNGHYLQLANNINYAGAKVWEKGIKSINHFQKWQNQGFLHCKKNINHRLHVCCQCCCQLINEILGTLAGARSVQFIIMNIVNSGSCLLAV